MGRNKKKGFTIVELVIVIAVIGILAAVLIPVFTTVVRKAKISRSVQNATNLSLQLVTDAAFDGVSYYLADQVIAKAEEYGYDLSSNVKGYAYFYDAAKNQVVFSEINEAVALAEETTFTRTVRNISHRDNLFYIDQASNAITDAINEIEKLAALHDYSRAAMIDAFKNVVTDNGKLDPIVKSYLSKFNPENTVYFTDKGIIYDKEKTVYENAVICAGTVSIPPLKDAVDIEIENPIVIPSSVINLSDGSFTNIKATLDIKTTVAYDAENISSNHSVVLNQISSTGEIVPLKESDYSINYGIAKEAKDAAGITYRLNATFDENANDYDYLTLGDLSEYAVESALVSEYSLPSLALRNNTFVNFGSIKKLTVRVQKVEGGMEYVMVAVDKDYNVYKLTKVGILDSSVLTYERDPLSSEHLTVSFGGEAINFENIRGAYMTIEYQYGYANLETKRFVFSNKYFYEMNGAAVWNDSSATLRIDSISAVNDIEIDLQGKTVDVNGEEQNCNVANVTRFTIYTSNGVAIYSAYFDAAQNSEDVAVTLDNNLTGDDHSTVTINAVSALPVALSFGSEISVDGLSFVGWNTMPDGSGKMYADYSVDHEKYTFTEDVTLYAIFEKLYSLTFGMLYPNNGKVYLKTFRFKDVRVGETFTVTEDCGKIKRGLSHENVEFKNCLEQLATTGFENLHWMANGRSNGYYFGTDSTEVIDGKEGSFEFDSSLAALGTSANSYTVYVWLMAYTDVYVYDENDVLIKTYENQNWCTIFYYAIDDGNEIYYAEPERETVL